MAPLNNRTARVARMKRNTTRKQLTRQDGQRELVNTVKPKKSVKFSNQWNNEFGVGFNNVNNNNNTQYVANLVKSRKSIQPTRPKVRNSRLSSNEAKFLANISANVGTAEEMLNAVNESNLPYKSKDRLFQKIKFMYD
jgi:hypothetical protein